MSVQRNPIAGSSDWKINTLYNNGFVIATGSKAQSQDSLNYWAGETGGNQYIIYSTKDLQSEAYPSGTGDLTPVAWGSFGLIDDSALIELINGLPGRVADTQFTDLGSAMTWLDGTGEYFVMNQDYPFISLRSPMIVWDPSIPQCSGFGYIGSKNLGNNNLGSFAPTLGIGDPNQVSYQANGGTAYAYMRADVDAATAAYYASSFSLDAYDSAGFTISCWWKCEEMPTIAPIMSWGAVGTNGFSLSVGSGRIWFGFGVNGSTQAQASYSWATDTWYYITLRWDDAVNTFQVYVDGTFVADQTTLDFDPTGTYRMYINGTDDTQAASGVFTSDKLILGNFILDDSSSFSSMAYNYNGWKSSGINGKY
jgi:hypothetical protein